jgi:hypothetical protein
MDTRMDLIQQLLLRGMKKTLRVSASIYKLASGNGTAGWIGISG